MRGNGSQTIITLCLAFSPGWKKEDDENAPPFKITTFPIANQQCLLF